MSPDGRAPAFSHNTGWEEPWEGANDCLPSSAEKTTIDTGSYHLSIVMAWTIVPMEHIPALIDHMKAAGWKLAY